MNNTDSNESVIQNSANERTKQHVQTMSKGITDWTTLNAKGTQSNPIITYAQMNQYGNDQKQMQCYQIRTAYMMVNCNKTTQVQKQASMYNGMNATSNDYWNECN